MEERDLRESSKQKKFYAVIQCGLGVRSSWHHDVLTNQKGEGRKRHVTTKSQARRVRM